MKTSLLVVFIVFVLSAFGQTLTYRDKKIYQGDTLVYEVLEIKNGNELLPPDYFESDSSQYYDYLIVDTNQRELLFLKSVASTKISDGHFPDRYASHRILQTDGVGGMELGYIREEDISIIADSDTYRDYLISYLIDYGLLTKNGLDRDLLDFFRFQHR